MSEGVNESRFYMWRAVVAMVHADGVVTPHELAFVNDYMRDIHLSSEQLEIVGRDLHTPQNVYDMFAKIKTKEDRKDFFALARALSWCDGDYDGQEKIIIEQLEKIHLSEENVSLLAESRDIFNEVELNQNQWKARTPQTQSLFGFLNKLRTA